MRYRRWYPVPRIGQRRKSSWFAILPVDIDGDIRWLEWVTVEWVVVERRKFLPPCSSYLKWEKFRYIDK